VAGTNVAVLGPAWSAVAGGTGAPRARGLRSVHVNVFSVTPLEIMRNVLDAGMVKQPDRVVRTPISTDHIPPGVFG